MRISQKMDTEHQVHPVSIGFEKTLVMLTVLGFLTIAGIYLLFI